MPANATTDTHADFLARMMTIERAERVARALTPAWEIADGSDCRAEIDHLGEPCRICADWNANWQRRIAEVRAAMLEAFR